MNALITGLKTKTDAASQREVASRLGVSEAMMSRILSGQRRPGRGTLRAIIREYPDLWPKVSMFLFEAINHQEER